MHCVLMEVKVPAEKTWSKEKSDSLTEAAPKTSPTGVTLIPQPSDDAKDSLVSPLLQQPVFIYSVLTKHSPPLELVIVEEVDHSAHLVSGIFRFYRLRPGKRPWILCSSQSLSQIQSDFSFILRKRPWHVCLDRSCAESLQVVASTGGIAVGPLLAVPLGRRYGRTFVFFWSMVGLLVTGIWSATMTRSNQYGAFVAARLFGGLCGGSATALGADTIVDIFFLHQRGKAFAVLNLSFLAGAIVGPTLSGFIVGTTNWTVQFWWSNGLEGIVILLTLALLQDTYYDRTPSADRSRKEWPDGFFANRRRHFFVGLEYFRLYRWRRR